MHASVCGQSLGSSESEFAASDTASGVCPGSWGCGQSLGQGRRNSVPKGGGKSVLREPSCGYPGVWPPLLKFLTALLG